MAVASPLPLLQRRRQEPTTTTTTTATITTSSDTPSSPKPFFFDPSAAGIPTRCRMDSPDDGVDSAQKLIQRWDSTASDDARDRMLFDGGDRAEADRYLRAVDEIRRVSLRDSSSATSSPRRSAAGSLQAAMARLEDEFRNILISRVNAVEADSLLSDFSSSLSISSSLDYGVDAIDDGQGSACGGSSRRPIRGEYGEEDEEEEEEEGGEGGSGTLGRSTTSTSMGSSCHRSTSSIREIDLVPLEAVQDLRSIADRMIVAGYGRECFQAYSSVRKAAVDQSLRQLGIEKLSIGDVQRLQWEALESKIRRWIRAAKACVRIVFASERRLCDFIFEGLAGEDGSGGGGDVPFNETVKGAALQLFGFAEAISIGRRSPEKLFKILDLHDALADLLPDIEIVFLRPNLSLESSIHTQAAEILSRLAEAARGILSEFENAVHLELSKTPVPGGTIHPLTRYVMNYINLISEYKPTLTKLIVSKPSAANRSIADAPDETQPPLPDISNLPEPENHSPLAAHLVWIIAILDSNLEGKAKLYRDAALAHLFLMNNIHYIVQKVKVSPELRDLIGDDYLRRLTGKFQQAATNYQRAAWVKVLQCLRDEGIHVSGSFSSGVSKGTLRERFKSFNAAFDEAHRTQSAWSVPDCQLREELRISISEKLLPAYRSFLGRFRHHIESGRHPEFYIKYSVEDLEMALVDFFESSTPSQQSRRRSH